MKTSQRYLVSVLALGWIVLVACCVILFWARGTTWTAFSHEYSLGVEVSLSGLVPEEIERDPNVSAHSYADASSWHRGLDMLWTSELEGQSRWDSEQGDWPVVSFLQGAKEGRSHLTYWDGRSGLFVLRWISYAPDTNRLILQEHLYAGPDGVSDRPSTDLGRFARPIVVYRWGTYPRTWWRIAYDSGSRRFYRIDWESKKVFKGPAIAQGIEPLQVGPSWTKGSINLDWVPPMRKVHEGEASSRRVMVWPRSIPI